jgi:hypothetical protein
MAHPPIVVGGRREVAGTVSQAALEADACSDSSKRFEIIDYNRLDEDWPSHRAKHVLRSSVGSSWRGVPELLPPWTPKSKRTGL